MDSSDDYKKAIFLEAYVEGANDLAGLRAADINRYVLRKWLDTDPQFIAMYEDARIDAVDSMVWDARNMSRKNSDMLKFLLKAYRPTMFADKVQVTNESRTVSELSDMELHEIIERSER